MSAICASIHPPSLQRVIAFIDGLQKVREFSGFLESL